jgi:hypothetical protein
VQGAADGRSLDHEPQSDYKWTMPLAPWPARLFLVAFVGAVAVCGVANLEAWPLTGFRLFAQERQPIARGWMATSVDARGRETPIGFERFPPPDRRFTGIMATFDRRSAADRAATCAAWARLVRRHGGSTAGGLRLYATRRDMRLHIGRREPVATRALLRWTCAAGRGAQAVPAGLADARRPR